MGLDLVPVAGREHTPADGLDPGRHVREHLGQGPAGYGGDPGLWFVSTIVSEMLK